MQVTEINDAVLIGDNLAEIVFFILGTSQEDTTLSFAVNSSAVSEAFEAAEVDEISGYTVSNDYNVNWKKVIVVPCYLSIIGTLFVLL